MSDTDWIRVEDKHPDEGDIVLGYSPEIGRSEMKYTDGRFQIYTSELYDYQSYWTFIVGVTHWMPWPKEPK